jgi:hypothetical protein
LNSYHSKSLPLDLLHQKLLRWIILEFYYRSDQTSLCFSSLLILVVLMISSQPITQQPEGSKGLASSSRDSAGGGTGGLTTEGVSLMRQAHTTGSDTFIHFRDLLPCSGTCCIISSCFVSITFTIHLGLLPLMESLCLFQQYKYPEVLGCTSKSTVCCTKTESACCRIPANDDETLLICNTSRCDLISPRLICQVIRLAW